MNNQMVVGQGNVLLGTSPTVYAKDYHIKHMLLKPPTHKEVKLYRDNCTEHAVRYAGKSRRVVLDGEKRYIEVSGVRHYLSNRVTQQLVHVTDPRTPYVFKPTAALIEDLVQSIRDYDPEKEFRAHYWRGQPAKMRWRHSRLRKRRIVG